MNKNLTALLLLALPPAAASAYTVSAPISGTVTTTTYSSNGTFHGAVDLTSQTACGYWRMETGVNASLSWDVSLRTSERACVGTNSNEAKHVFASGFTFRIRSFLYVGGLTRNQTCNRCPIGDATSATGNVGHPNHLQYDKSGTNSTAWYSGVAPGDFLDHGDFIGNVG